MMGVFGLETIK